MTQSNLPDRSTSESTPEETQELSLTPPRVQRPKIVEVVHKAEKPLSAPPSPKSERVPRVVPKPRKVKDGDREMRPEKPEPVPEYGDRKAGDEIVLPYSGKTVQISHFYQSAGHWYAAFEVGCVRIDSLEKNLNA